ncbi:MAG: zinc ribbon domain-containing protein [Candidatus Eisenbacteria bacterium]|nr:zinc ribbon domain-containing protein [Candidatus Eisenbacteria bacterium]
MPTYEYECTKCGHRFERFQSMNDEPVKRCPKCRCKVRRILSGGAGILFKGSGFYQTDYRSAEYKKREREEKKTPVKPAEKKEGSGSASEPKPKKTGGGA